ncbi:NAD(P)/FAD-dependent oxidoreductase [Rhodococcus triatomae]|nr:FAD-dependent pyridine nucleotide-disulfide oxidoreductase [Rhodococcus triatomae BKS 15-14]
MKDSYDVVIVGGGAAGLGGALALTRARRSVVVIDGGAPRNAPAEHMHNYLGREGTAPRDLLAIGREEVAGYGGEIVDGQVVEATRTDDGFRVRTAAGSEVSARMLLVTTGLVDELPDVPGVGARWGRDVLHCPYCHGWEVRDAAIGVIATSPVATHQVLMWRQWTNDLILFTHTAPDFSSEDLEKFAASGIEIVDGRVAGVEATGDRLTGVSVEGRGVIARDALVVPPRFVARSALLESLGVETAVQEMGDAVIGSYVPAGPTGETSVPGVWVAGNVTNPRAQVISAAAGGVDAGAMINAALIEQDVAARVAERRMSRLG